MSILKKLATFQQAHRRQPSLTAEAELVAEYDAMRRAYTAALARNNVEGALLWSVRANEIAREMARRQDYLVEKEEPAFCEEKSA